MKGSKTDSLAGCRAPLYLQRDNSPEALWHVRLLCLRACLSHHRRRTTSCCMRLDLCPSSLTTQNLTEILPHQAVHHAEIEILAFTGQPTFQKQACPQICSNCMKILDLRLLSQILKTSSEHSAQSQKPRSS